MFLVIIAVFAAADQAPRRAAQPIAAQIRARLTTYEQQAAAGRQDPAELAAIASTVLEDATRSPDVTAATEACSSPFLKKDVNCTVTLWTVARRPAATLAHRVRAAAALVNRKDQDAAGYLFDLVKAVPGPQLAPFAESLRALPARKAVPLLASMLQSSDPAAHISGCQALSHIDAPESLQVVKDYLTSAPRGTRAWYICTIAAAKLGDPDGQRTTGYITSYLSGDELVSAGDVLLNLDQERAIGLFMQAARESRGLAQLDAAARLVPFRPEIATEIMEGALSNNEPGMRAAALQLHRALKIEPSRHVRQRLLDSSPLVQVRAAETILSADVRRRGI
jgi:HEAT repeat protein